MGEVENQMRQRLLLSVQVIRKKPPDVSPVGQYSFVKKSGMVISGNMATFGMCARLVGRIYATNNTPLLHLISRRVQNGRFCTAANGEPKKETPPEGDSTREVELAAELEKMMKEKKQVDESLVELKDKYQRTLAEQQNLRTRFTKQVEDAKLYGTQSFCKDLLEVADILGKATESVPREHLTDDNPHLKNLFEGLSMTEKELKKVFEKNGLSLINPVDAKFDPNEHEALFEQVVEGKEPGTVALVTKPGYKLHNRVLRAALVGVVKKSS